MTQNLSPQLPVARKSKLRGRALIAAALGLVSSFAFTACETPGQTALLGAGTGALIGGRHGSGRGAVKGAAIGAGAGYVAGRVVQRDRERAYEDGYYDGRTRRRY